MTSSILSLGINVVDLGLVYGLTVSPDRIATIDMTLTSAACPLTDVIEDQTRTALEGLVEDFRINWVWMPPWGPDKITDDGPAAARPRIQHRGQPSHWLVPAVRDTPRAGVHMEPVREGVPPSASSQPVGWRSRGARRRRLTGPLR